MATTLTNPYFEYVPQLGRSVWIKRDVIIHDNELVDGGYREMVWATLSYSDSQTGPWTYLTQIPYSMMGVSGI